MISLYTNNLNSIGIQAALIASLAFTAVNNVYQQAEISSSILAYGYNVTYTVSDSIITQCITFVS